MESRWLLLVIAFGASLATYPTLADDETQPLSPAQTALFETDHLRTIDEAERLQYRFDHQAASASDAYVDRVNLDVRPRSDGAKDVWVEFLTGKHHMPFPPLSGFHGNPVLMYFLERDVETMHAQTGGAASYFRNRIRRAFVDKAELRQIELERDGRKSAATEITVAPFRDDSRIAAFPGLQDKRYRFVLSDDVPGGIYEITSEIPGDADKAPRLKETMTFAATEPCSNSEGPCAAPTSP
jgi:hypothetical protein